jgi:hypothetical protein
MFLAVMCQHTSDACQSHSCPVLNLHEALWKYIELSPSTPLFLTLRLYEKDLTPSPNLLRISGQYSLRSGIFDTPSARAYLFSLPSACSVEVIQLRFLRNLTTPSLLVTPLTPPSSLISICRIPVTISLSQWPMREEQLLITICSLLTM